MIRLHLLGRLSLVRNGGTDVGSVLAQPKRCALLAYLACHPGAPRTRDTLLGVFWPELDEAHARKALRQSLYGLRRSLGPRVLTGKGEERVGIDTERLWCDAVAFQEALSAGEHEVALELYRGPFLEGVHLSDVPAFERWVEGERRRLRRLAVDAAWELAATADRDGRASDARRWAERALALAPVDEEHLRQYLELLARHGDRAAAVRGFETYRRRLAEELDLEPSARTVALIERIREGSTAAVPAATEPPEDTPAPPAASRSPPAIEAAPSPQDTDPEVTPPPAGDGGLVAPHVAVAFAVLLALTAYAVLAPHRGRSDGRSAPVRSVAVLPLENLSEDPEQAYLAAAMTDQLVTELAQVRDLTVISRQATAPYRSGETPLRTIAEELGADAVVEGSVLRTGGRIRIAARLVDTRTEAHLWASDYLRDVDDLLGVQKEVALAVAQRIHGRLTPEERDRLVVAPDDVDPAAHDAYLRALHHVHRYGLGDADPSMLEDAIDAFREALALEPEWAAAHARLAGALHWLGTSSVGTSELMLQAKEAALEAIRLDPSQPAAYGALAYVRGFYEWDWEGAERAYRRAFELDPNSDYLGGYGLLLLATGRYEEAADAFRKALERRPMSPNLTFQLAWALGCAGDYEEARRLAESLTTGPDPEVGYMHLGSLHLAQGEPEKAIRSFEAAGRAAEDLVGHFRGLAHAHLMAGRPDRARVYLRQLEHHDAWRPDTYALLGDTEGALGELRWGVERRFPHVALLRCHLPGFVDLSRLPALRDEPAFQRILREIGFPEPTPASPS